MYGWRPDRPDPRDFKFSVSTRTPLPDRVDLRPYMPPVYDQGQLGSCTANAIAGALEYIQIKQKEPRAVPSRLFIYYNERDMEDSVDSDAGASLRDGIKSVHVQGAPEESLWPYDINQFAVRPPAIAYEQALLHEALKYERITRGGHGSSMMKIALAQGLPFVFGFTVFSSFESDEVAKTGVVPLPYAGEAPVGGHAVLAVGYEHGHFIVRNSWSDQWGDKGYCYMPEQYLLNAGLANDFWAISKVE
jgi:C1A family cysteine protease